MSRRRVVITGIGAVTPLGVGVETSWDGLVSGRNGIATITAFDASEGYTSQIAGECTDFRTEDYFPRIESKKLDRFSQFALVSAEEALRDSGVLDSEYDPRRAGVVLGSGIGGIIELVGQEGVRIARGPRRVSPFFIPKMMANAMSGQISIKFGFQGTNFATSSACASASHAMGMALRSVQYGESDIMISGGSESAITPVSIAGFCAMKAMSRRNDSPETASRPFDKDRDGFVMGEGCVIFVLEEFERARAREANIYAELVGYGSTADAYHITAPKEDGTGPAGAMSLALEDGGLAPDEVDYINAHGTSTKYNDVVETRAIHQVFGDHARKVAISSSKSMTGHLLGAAGGIGSLAASLSVARGVVHPTRNLDQPDPSCDLDYVPGDAREMRVRASMSNALGFGGHNVCLAFRGVER